METAFHIDDKPELGEPFDLMTMKKLEEDKNDMEGIKPKI